MKLRQLQSGELAVVLTGGFKHEVFYRNVAGIHSLTKDRYWPNAQAKVKGYEHFHEGPLDEEVELIDKDRLKYLAPTLPVVEVIEVGDHTNYTVRDFAFFGSNVAKLLQDLQFVNCLKIQNARLITMREAQEKAQDTAKKVRNRVILLAMYELSNGEDLRLLTHKTSGRSTVREFIHSIEDGE